MYFYVYFISVSHAVTIYATIFCLVLLLGLHTPSVDVKFWLSASGLLYPITVVDSADVAAVEFAVHEARFVCVDVGRVDDYDYANAGCIVSCMVEDD